MIVLQFGNGLLHIKLIVRFDLAEGRFSAQEASLYAAKNDEIDMAEKIMQLLDDPALRQKMGEIGRARVVNELEWKYQVPVLLAAYEALESSHSVPASQISGD